jgi:glycosidase
MDNTSDKGIGTDGHFYSAYHGYWPTNLDQTEEHFGSWQDLQALVTAAHDHDLKVILDYAMNHVHSSSPVYADHKDWFWPNDNGKGGNCVCGQGCSWDEAAEARRCWFTDYLPDFNFEDAAARKFSVDNAIKWIEDTGIDGFRLDAVKHIADPWLFDMRARVKADIESVTQEHFYMVGETFTGKQDVIKYYVRPDMLDGQFDFPLRMQMAATVLLRKGSMADLAGFMDQNDNYYGNGIMSTFIGNHDIPRAIHLAEDTPLWGDQWADGKDQGVEQQAGGCRRVLRRSSASAWPSRSCTRRRARRWSTTATRSACRARAIRTTAASCSGPTTRPGKRSCCSTSRTSGRSARLTRRCVAGAARP